MFRVSEWSLAAGLLVMSCTTTKSPPQKDTPTPDQATSLSTDKAKLIRDPTPGQAIIAAREWLKELRGTDAARLSSLTGYPFVSHGFMSSNGPDAEGCRTKEGAATKEAFLETAACMMKNPLIRDNLPTNLEVNSTFKIEFVTLEKAFEEQKELKEIWARKKELEGACCRAFVQAYFPGDKQNAYLLLAIEWIKGDIRVVSALAELDPIE
jgi:hypothetical protein